MKAKVKVGKRETLAERESCGAGLRREIEQVVGRARAELAAAAHREGVERRHRGQLPAAAAL